VTPLAELIGAHVMGAPMLHTDDTPIAVLGEADRSAVAVPHFPGI
jgi:hypothetical protein